MQFLRNGLIIGTGQNDVPHIHRAGQDQCQRAVDEVQVGHQQVGGHQAAPKEHGNEEKGVDGLAPHELGQAQGIGRQQADDGGKHRKGGGVQEGIEEAPADHIVLKDAAVTFQGPVLGQKADALVGEHHRVDEGGQHHINQRDQHRQREQPQQGIPAPEDDFILAGVKLSGFHGFRSFRYRPSPSLSLLTMALTVSSNTTLITALNRPTAVEYP